MRSNRQLSPVSSCLYPTVRSYYRLQNSDRHRLIHAQFKEVPLFWQVDIEVFAESIQRNEEYDLSNESAIGSDCSLTHTTLMQAVMAVKGLLRGQEEATRELLSRRFQKVGLEMPDLKTHELVLHLVQHMARIDPSVRDLAHRIELLYDEAFGPKAP